MMIARGRFCCGSLISPASWSACSKPRVGEDDAGQRQRREQALDAAGEQARAAGGEVAGVELEQQHDDGQDRDRDLPPRDDAVDLVEDAHGQEVDGGEERHQHRWSPRSRHR